MTVGAVVVLRSMARRWRAGEPTCPRRTVPGAPADEAERAGATGPGAR